MDICFGLTVRENMALCKGKTIYQALLGIYKQHISTRCIYVNLWNITTCWAPLCIFIGMWIVVLTTEETWKFYGYYFHCSYFSTNQVLSNMYKDRVPSVQNIKELNALCIDDKPVEKKIRIPAKSEFSSAVTYDPIVQ